MVSKVIQPLISIEAHDADVACVAYSRQEQLIASGSDDTNIKLFKASTGALHSTITDHSQAVRAIAFSRDGRLLASGGMDAILYVRSISQVKSVMRFSGHEGAINAVCFSPNGNLIVTGGDDGSIRLWNWLSQESDVIAKSHSGPVTSIAFFPNGQRFASTGFDKTVRIWDAAGKQLISEFSADTMYIHSVAISPKGSLLATAASTVKSWDAVTQQFVILSTKHQCDTFLSVAFNARGNLLAGGGRAREKSVSAYAWNLLDRELFVSCSGCYATQSIVFDDQGKYLIGGCEGGIINIWHLQE